MIETDLINEVVVDGRSDIVGLRVGRTTYPLWKTDGIRRKCRIDDLVVKFDSEGTAGQTYAEAVLSTRIQVPDRKNFVEVLHTGAARAKTGTEYRWAAQPFVEVVANRPDVDRATILACEAKVNILVRRYNIGDLGGFGVNWTILNGEPLIYDYGFSNIHDGTFKKT